MIGLSINVDNGMNETGFRRTFNSMSVLSIALHLFILGCGTKPEYQFTSLDPLSAGIDFRNDIVETQTNNILRNEYTYNGGGVAVGDINKDGYTDVYFAGNSVSNRLYINNGKWKFEDITRFSGTQGRRDWATGVVMVDVNGDGWLDIYVCYSGNSPGEGYNMPVIRDNPRRANQLFINNGCEPGGKPTFTERAKEFGLDAIGTFSNQAYFFDYDLDGDLDMFLQNHANTFYAPFINTEKLRNLRHPYFGNKLYRNDNMQFIEVSEEAGIHGSGLNFGLSTAITDINMDNWPDLYVTNDYDEQDYCYINNHDGTFKEVSHLIVSHMSKSSMGSDVGDVNNDGYVDILVSDMLPEDNYREKLLRGQDGYERFELSVDSGFHHQYVRNTLQLNRGLANDGLPRYSEIGQFSGISNTDWSWSALLVDLDNDGLRDLFVTNGYLKDITNMDNMTRTKEIYRMAREKDVQVNYLRLIQDLPTTKLQNYVYKNINGIKFRDMSEAWGIHEKTVSNGTAYADFDNDGDYDIVMNNLGQIASIIKNNQDEIQKNNYVKLKLIGGDANTMGIGAKIWLETEDKTIFQEAYNTRGYLSSSDLVKTIGIGNSREIKSIKVIWPGGRQSEVMDVAINKLIELEYEKSAYPKEAYSVEPNKTLLKDATQLSGINFRHVENNFNDYDKSKLLQYRLSRLGGELATGDVNNDGNDDVFFGGASGYSGELYLGNDDGEFSISQNQPWEMHGLMEDMQPLFFDADDDGDLDLYVVSGGNAFGEGSAQYQDRFYMNNGNGKFIDKSAVLPRESISGSCVVPGDFDKDGDLDLFVGGRHMGMRYPLPPKSSILRNDSANGQVKYVDATSEVSSAIEHIGMVTDAQWTDFNNDDWLDLIIVGEWMAISIFKNESGQLVKQEISSLEKSHGWWTTVKEADIDGDGDQDYLLGNVGSNLQFRASPDEPLELYAYDFNNDGVIDPIFSYYNMGQNFPFHSRNEFLDQLKPFQKIFFNYESYARATIQDVIEYASKDKIFQLKTYIIESCWLENTEDGFNLHKLPDMVQFSQVNSFACDDFNSDGNQDIIAAGNFFPLKPKIGMLDASFGALLQYNNDSLTVMHDAISPLWLGGDIRDMEILNFNNDQKMLVVSRNNDSSSVFLINSTGM
jgi:hypothetical protein